MKRLLFIIPFFLLAACNMGPSVSQLMFQGDHYLRKMGSVVGSNSHSDMQFFLFGFSGTSESHSEPVVTFAWTGNNGEYIVSSLPVSKFRISFDPNASVPHIKFRWRPCYQDCDADKDALIEYVVLTCREQDW